MKRYSKPPYKTYEKIKPLKEAYFKTFVTWSPFWHIF